MPLIEPGQDDSSQNAGGEGYKIMHLVKDPPSSSEIGQSNEAEETKQHAEMDEPDDQE